MKEPDKLRRIVAKLHDLTAEQVAQLEGTTLDQLAASAKRLKAATTGTTDGASTFVDEAGRTYDGGGTAVDGGGRELVAEALAARGRRNTHTSRPGTGRGATSAEDALARSIRIEERLGDALGWKPARDRRIQKLIQQTISNTDPKDAA